MRKKDFDRFVKKIGLERDSDGTFASNSYPYITVEWNSITNCATIDGMTCNTIKRLVDAINHTIDEEAGRLESLLETVLKARL